MTTEAITGAARDSDRSQFEGGQGWSVCGIHEAEVISAPGVVMNGRRLHEGHVAAMAKAGIGFPVTARSLILRDSRYAQLAGPAIEAGGGRFPARGIAAASYEDGVTERTVIIEFESVEQAIATHDGAAQGRARRAGRRGRRPENCAGIVSGIRPAPEVQVSSGHLERIQETGARRKSGPRARSVGSACGVRLQGRQGRRSCRRRGPLTSVIVR